MPKADRIEDIEHVEKTREERRIPANSHFEVEFDGGEKRHEDDTSWNDFSDERKVKFLDDERIVPVSKFKVKKLTLVANGKTVVMVPKDDEEIYQMIHSRVIFVPGGKTENTSLGRVVGIVKGDEVIEEKYISLLTDEVVGFKK